ncbi:tripartite tricarboxylate transporter TctB family protein [Microbacterium sp.]|uniref:tripartite tricarboxylate transporter TctB family protein n=1 Tax=Microbacterium sp. TaxID=51671 RepID=UPI002811709D|nr:tripartite tricarboxylate transporter TctB family protein [Microbacterium sp.]
MSEPMEPDRTRGRELPGLTTTNLAAIEKDPPPVSAGAYPAVVSGVASLIIGAIMVIAAVLVIVDALRLPASSDPLGPAAFPLVIGALLGVLGASLIVTNARFGTVLLRSGRSGIERGAVLGRRALLRAALVLVALILFALILPFAGFFVSGAALYVAGALLLGAPRGWHLPITGVLIAGSVVLLFDRLIGLALPAGPWGF